MKIENNKLIANFKIDCINNTLIDWQKYKHKFKILNPNRKCIYLSEIADLYYHERYNKNILECFNDYIEIPKCPISNNVVSYKHGGNIIFGKYSSNVSPTEISNYVAKNNENYKQHVENMKRDRKGEKNPMFGIQAWNKGLSAENNAILKQNSDRMLGNIPSEETKNKQSESAKKRLIHGHTGFKHSEESKQKMREKTIARLKSGSFPQTNSLPHREFRNILINNNINNFEEEFVYGKFTFDFKVNNYLIEVQGDFFHANPETRHSGATHNVQKINVSRDRAKRKWVETNNQYQLIEVWEKDILNNNLKVIKCIQNLINQH